MDSDTQRFLTKYFSTCFVATFLMYMLMGELYGFQEPGVFIVSCLISLFLSIPASLLWDTKFPEVGG